MSDMGALEALVARLEKVTSLLEGRLDGQATKQDGVSGSIHEANGAPESKALGLSPSVVAYDELLSTRLGRVNDAAGKIGGSVLQVSDILKNAFVEERQVVLAISQCKNPDSTDLQKLVGPLGEVIAEAHNLAEGRRSDAFNHQKVVAESLAGLSWIVYSGKDCGLSLPGPHVEESWQSAEFYNNKILVEYKAKDPNHVEWAKAVKELYVPGLRDYAKEFHTTGPAWNVQGVEVSQFCEKHEVSASAAPAARTPPPPPAKAPPPPPKGPPPPPPHPSLLPAASPTPAASMSAVFQEISKGEAVTAGLKKVTDDMKTKNRADRTGAVPAGTKSEMGSPAAPAAKAASKKPIFELQLGRKWAIENQVGNKGLILDDTTAKQSVYIFGCKDSTIQVKGKVNNITVDNCTKTAVVFSDVVAAFEVVNCTSVEVQCQGSAPTIAVDNTNGCQLYLSAGSLKSSITTAKSSEVNVAVPGSTPDDDLVEHALPEQFLNVFEDGQFITTPVSHSGG